MTGACVRPQSGHLLVTVPRRARDEGNAPEAHIQCTPSGPRCSSRAALMAWTAVRGGSVTLVASPVCTAPGTPDASGCSVRTSLQQYGGHRLVSPEARHVPLMVRHIPITRPHLPGSGADDQLLHGVASARHLHLSTTLKPGCIFFLLFGVPSFRGVGVTYERWRFSSAWTRKRRADRNYAIPCHELAQGTIRILDQTGV